MIKHLYALRDSASDVYSAPMVAISEKTMIRELVDAKKNPDNMLGRYPEHYDLFYLGTYDDTRCVMELLDSPSHVSKLCDLSLN